MPTLAEARRQLARQAGLGLTVFKTGIEGPPGTYVGSAGGSDARRTIVSSDLVRMAVSGSADVEVRSDYHDAQWVYWPKTGTLPPEQHSLANQGYQANVTASSVTDQGSSTESVAVLKAIRNFSTIIPSGQTLELHAACPVVDADQMTGLHSHLNRSLRAMYFRSRIPLIGNGSNRVRLDAFPWISDEAQLIAVTEADQQTSGPADQQDDPKPFCRGELRFDGQSGYLLLDRKPASGQPFSADVWRPRSTWIGRAGVWGDSSVGCVDETDEASVDLDQWVVVAYYFVCDALSQSNPRGEIASWAKRRDRAAIRAAPFMQWQRPAVVQRQTRRYASWGYGRRFRGRLAGGWP